MQVWGCPLLFSRDGSGGHLHPSQLPWHQTHPLYLAAAPRVHHVPSARKTWVTLSQDHAYS